MKDVLGVPESLFMLFDTVVAFDHFFQVVKVITYVNVPENLDDVEKEYNVAKATLSKYVSLLKDKDVPMPEQGPIKVMRFSSGSHTETMANCAFTVTGWPGIQIEHWQGGL
jgi:hypothetical protein